jgi:RNA polymerase sigma-70 factor, ECF subfamily
MINSVRLTFGRLAYRWLVSEDDDPIVGRPRSKAVERMANAVTSTTGSDLDGMSVARLLEGLAAAAATCRGTEQGRQAFEQIHRLYNPRLFGYVELCVRDTATAEDLTSEIWLKIAERIDTYQGRGFKTWALRIAQRHISDHYRARGARAYETPTADMLSVDQPLPGMSTEEIAERHDLAFAVAAILAKLPTRQRQVLRWRYWGGLSVDETAEMMGIKAPSVRVLQCRALGRLKKLVPTPEGAGSGIAEILLDPAALSGREVPAVATRG